MGLLAEAKQQNSVSCSGKACMTTVAVLYCGCAVLCSTSSYIRTLQQTDAYKSMKHMVFKLTRAEGKGRLFGHLPSGTPSCTPMPV